MVSGVFGPIRKGSGLGWGPSSFVLGAGKFVWLNFATDAGYWVSYQVYPLF